MSQLPSEHQFVENLIALKNHYQSVQEARGREKSHALQQLGHVDALLVDSMVEPGFVENLAQLQQQYQSVVNQCDRLLSNAREQLIHVNALLADQFVQQYEQRQAIEAAVVDEQEQQLAFNGSAKAEWRASSTGFPYLSPKELTAHEETSPEKIQEPGQLGIFSKPNTPVDSTTVEESPELNEQETAGVEDEQELGLINAPVVRRQEQLSPVPKTPMLAKFENLTKLQAIKSMMEEKAGSILSVDWLVRALHGELEAQVAEQEKPRIAQVLRDGAAQGLWQQVPKQAGYYITP